MSLSMLSAVPALRVPAPMMQMQMQGVGAPVGQQYAGGVVPTRARVATDSSILVQGGSLRTWSYRSPSVEQVQVILSTEGRPLDADIELWHGPDNTPCKMRVYVENGQLRPYSRLSSASGSLSVRSGPRFGRGRDRPRSGTFEDLSLIGCYSSSKYATPSTA